MADAGQAGWTRVLTRTGRYEYQFQGRVPAVRHGQYEDAQDYQFLVMDEEGWLYKIPVRFAADAEAEVRKQDAEKSPAPPAQATSSEALRIAAAHLRAGLESYRPRQNVAYGELDAYFDVNLARARELLRTAGS